MPRSLSGIELGALLTMVGMIISATVFLTTLSVGQSSLRSRIESLERGTTIDQNKENAIRDFRQEVEAYNIHEIPVGSILPYFGSEAPRGFLICDGSQFTKDSAPRLFAYFKSQFPELIKTDEIAILPDLKGRFLRGAGRIIDEGKVSEVGRAEEGSIESHKHFYSRVSGFYSSHHQGNPLNGWADVPEVGESEMRRSGEGGDKSNKFGMKIKSMNVITSAPVKPGNETRPMNVSVTFIMKI